MLDTVMRQIITLYWCFPFRKTKSQCICDIVIGLYFIPDIYWADCVSCGQIHPTKMIIHVLSFSRSNNKWKFSLLNISRHCNIQDSANLNSRYIKKKKKLDALTDSCFLRINKNNNRMTHGTFPFQRLQQKTFSMGIHFASMNTSSSSTSIFFKE